MIDDITKISLLYDFYGAMLTKRQSEVIGLYYEENCSLSEIAEELGISRQGVYDALKNAQKSLCEYEEKLGLVEKFTETGKAVSKIDKTIDGIIDDYKENKELTKRLTDIKKIIDKLDE
ncbi:MAG: YlxM family DNA-binding protein [Eubacteriaceae bacterium]|nr:YlxM family DNA-binding protein [Eubacteriaceae bacterium]